MGNTTVDDVGLVDPNIRWWWCFGSNFEMKFCEGPCLEFLLEIVCLIKNSEKLQLTFCCVLLLTTCL